MAPMFRHTDQGTKARAAWKGLRCTIQIFPLISQINWYCWLQQPFPSFSVNLEHMVAFWQLKKSSKQQVLYLKSGMSVASAQEAKSFCGICFTFLMVCAHYK